MRANAERPSRPSWWQRRYLLKHFGAHDDRALSRSTGLSVGAVQRYLESQRAIRTRAEVHRIERTRKEAPPCWTPGRALARITRLESRPLTWVDGCLVGGLFLVSLGLYAITAARTVTGEDAGELIAAAHALGVPHPPGYPLWTLLGAAFDRLFPWGTVAWRVTMVSSVFAAAANALLLAVALKTLRSRWAAVFGAALFAVSLTHWTQSVIPEVYGLNSFFVAAGVLLLIRLSERPTTGRLLLLAAVAGLGCTNHTTSVPVAGILAIAAVCVAPQLFRRPLAVFGALVAGVAPLLLYAYLPWASAQDPYLDWGNPETLDGLIAHVTRSQYTAAEEGRLVEAEYGEYLRRLGILARSMGDQFGSPWILVLAVIGFYSLMIRQTGPWLVLMAIAWLCSIGITQYSNYRFDREHVYAAQIFFIPAWLVVSWLLAGGLDTLLASLRERLRSASWGAPAALAPVAVGLVLLPAVSHVHRADRSKTTLVAAYGRALLDVMEPGALYFPSSDHSTFAVLYWQGVEDYRTDVTVGDKYGRIEQHLLDRFLDDEIRAEIQGRPGREQRRILERALIERWPGPVYFSNRRDMADLPGHVQEPAGPLFRIFTHEEAKTWWMPTANDGRPPGLAIWDQFDALDLDDPTERLDITVQVVAGDLRYMRGFAMARSGDLDGATATWEAIEADLAPLKQIFNNVGSALAEHGHWDRALAFYERALEEDPSYVMALRNAAIIQRDHGDPARATKNLERLVVADPHHREGRLELASLLSKQGREVEALRHYEALAVQDPRDPAPWAEAGRLLERIGDLTKAEEAYTESLRLNPAQLEVAQALERLQRGVPRLLADGPQPSLPRASEHSDGSALAELAAGFGEAPVGPPMPRLPGAGDALLPGTPTPTDPTRGLFRQPTVPQPGTGERHLAPWEVSPPVPKRELP